VFTPFVPHISAIPLEWKSRGQTFQDHRDFSMERLVGLGPVGSGGIFEGAQVRCAQRFGSVPTVSAWRIH
jgi:hypothetical protein